MDFLSRWATGFIRSVRK